MKESDALFRCLSFAMLCLFAWSCEGNAPNQDSEKARRQSGGQKSNTQRALASIGSVLQEFDSPFALRDNHKEIVGRLLEILEGLGCENRSDNYIKESLKYLLFYFSQYGFRKYDLEPIMDEELSALKEKLEMLVSDDKTAQDDLDAFICELAALRNAGP